MYIHKDLTVYKRSLWVWLILLKNNHFRHNDFRTKSKTICLYSWFGSIKYIIEANIRTIRVYIIKPDQHANL